MTNETVSQQIVKHADVLDDELHSARAALLVALANAPLPSEKDGMGTHLEPLIDRARTLEAISHEVGNVRDLGEQIGRVSQ